MMEKGTDNSEAAAASLPLHTNHLPAAALEPGSIGNTSSEITAPATDIQIPEITFPDKVLDMSFTGSPEIAPHEDRTVVNGTTIWTTNGFYRRGHENVAALGGVIAKKIMAEQPEGSEFTILDAGCSQGRDTWTLASVLSCYGINYRVDAVDANSLMLDKATQPYKRTRAALRGDFDRWRRTGVPAIVTEQFEDVDDEHIQPSAHLRGRVTFTQADLRDPFETPRPKYKAAICNNVLLYYHAERDEPSLVGDRIVRNIANKLEIGGLFTYVGGWAVRPWLDRGLDMAGLVRAENDYGIPRAEWAKMSVFRKFRETNLD
jgi:chemotaxis methyl-accepting protein methylase